MNHTRMTFTVSAVIMLLTGIWLFLFPISSLATVVRMIGAAVLLYGAVGVAAYFLRIGGYRSAVRLTRALVTAAAGVFIVSNPGFIIRVFPVLAGVVIAAGGVDNLFMALAVRDTGSDSWLILLALSVVTIAAGVFLISNPFAVQSTLVRVTGVILAYNGFVGLFGSLRL